ncbi:helix-turn-helix domain-containing protein [Pararhizobium gei]|uniref:helix-turn-helix domain-containing protein n=1 Tax=Pararhizobium gei TaxID=1395951 RepID=UPI0023DA45A2|nr:helix-turn-helix transcriptional regulator [Rhizobium gei]
MTIPLPSSDSMPLQRLDAGNVVKRFREASGYSLEDLAVTCGLTDVEILKIEKGEDTDSGRLKRVAAALQIPAATFEPL